MKKFNVEFSITANICVDNIEAVDVQDLKNKLIEIVDNHLDIDSSERGINCGGAIFDRINHLDIVE